MKGSFFGGNSRVELWRTPGFVGFAAHWTWILCVFWSSLYYDEGSVIVPGLADYLPLEPLWFISLLANVLTLGCLLMLSHYCNPFSSVRFLPWLGAGLTAGGTLLTSHLTSLLSGDIAVMLYLLGSVLTGVGSAVIVVLWGELLTSLGSRQAVSYCVCAFIIAAGMFMITLAIAPDIRQLVIAMLPMVSVGLFVRFKHAVPHLSRLRRNVHVKVKPPGKLIAISLFFGFSFGIMKGLFIPIDATLVDLRNLLNIAAIVGASLAVFLTTNVYKMDFDHMTYQVALPLMAAGFLFIPLYEPWNIIGTGVHQFGYQYFYIILWALWPVLAFRANVVSGWIVAWGLFSVQLGQFSGSVVSAYLVELLIGGFALALLAAGAIFLILLIALFALGKGSPNTGWGYVKPIEEDGMTSDFERVCSRIARQYRLSPREIEVFFLLAKGRNRAHIKDELFVSDETVKSHVKNIYRKIDLHSQQALIDMIEEENSPSFPK